MGYYISVVDIVAYESCLQGGLLDVSLLVVWQQNENNARVDNYGMFNGKHISWLVYVSKCMKHIFS